jgi:malonate transporter and related proteins
MANSIAVLLPIFFVLALGYFAGRTKEFDQAQASGLNELVITYALPASLFVGASKTPRDQLLAQGTFFIALLIAFAGLQVLCLLVAKFFFHQTAGAAGLQAFMSASPTSPFLGTPILNGLYGASSATSIALSAIIINVIQIPLTLILLEIEKSQKTGEHANLNQTVKVAVLKSLKQPLVLAPILAFAIVLTGVKVPNIIDQMLSLIGVANSGVAVFFSGLTIAAHKLKLNRIVITNSITKAILQPLLMAALVIGFGISNPDAQEGILICAICSTLVGPILASRYRLYEADTAATLLLSAMMMIVTLPITISLVSR